MLRGIGAAETDRQVLAALSALGEPAAVDVVATVADVDLLSAVEALERLQSSGEVASPAPMLFSLSGAPELSGPLLALCHARAAAALIRRGAADGVISDHLLRSPGTSDPRNVEILRRHAQSCLSSDPQRAVACLRRALNEPPPEEALNGTLNQLADALLRAQEPGEAAEVAGRVRSRTSRQNERITAAITLSRALRTTTGPEAAVRTLVSELGLLGEGNQGERLRLHHELVRQGASSELALRSWLQLAENDREESGHRNGFSLLISSQNLLRGGLRAEEAVTELRGELARHPVAELEPYGLLSALWLLIRADQPDLACRLLEEQRVAGPPRSAIELAFRGVLQLRYGTVTQAVACLQEALGLAMAGAEPVEADLASAFLAQALFEAGETVRFDELLAAHDPDSLPEESAWSAIRRVARGRARIAAGSIEDGLADLLRVEESKQRLRLTNPAGYHHAEPAVHALLRLGRADEARALAHTNLERARAWDAPLTVALATSAVAACAPPVQSDKQFERAQRLLRPWTPSLFQAQILLHSTEPLLRTNRTAQGEQRLRETLHVAAQIGAGRLVEEAKGALHALGRRPRRTAMQGVDALTRAELGVARLAAQGLPNKEIARARHLSVRTVENHLRSVYHKLRTNRAGLRAVLGGGPGGPPAGSSGERRA
ncbi:MAG TPA: LuxR C-terminal-related transcriptional regulator [Solirubrobacteraceae bacterium]|nr:LuxR C-terminal-related transcriptional regulator [Solirubrobacteraceae bacterium]